MSLKFVIPMAVATACLPLAGNLHAATYTETGDAGDLPATAQVISGAPATSLTSLSGALTLTNGTSDSDMFAIYINSPSTFSASLTAFVPGANNFDSQLMIFNSAGKGIQTDDDDPNTGAPQSNLPAGGTLMSSQAAGVYYLLISGSGRYAVSGTNSLIFPNFTDGTTDPTVVYGATGPGGANTITGYTGSSNEGGNYTIALAGAQFVVVPEPSTWALVAAGVAGLALVARSRRPVA